MISFATVAQSTTPVDSSSAAAAVFGVFFLVGILSLVAITKRGRRTVGPLVAILLGASIIATTISDASKATVSAITFLGLFFGGIVAIGGIGALREGMSVPEVDGVEPEIHSRSPFTPGDDQPTG
jgi:hypothetical protein